MCSNIMLFYTSKWCSSEWRYILHKLLVLHRLSLQENRKGYGQQFEEARMLYHIQLSIAIRQQNILAFYHNNQLY